MKITINGKQHPVVIKGASAGWTTLLLRGRGYGKTYPYNLRKQLEKMIKEAK